MWTKSHSNVYQGILKESIWRLWTDVNNWTTWHHDLEECRMEGPFVVGNRFSLRSQGMKKAVSIVLANIVDGSEFTDCTTFFGAKMYDTHKVEETPEGLRITNQIKVTGPLAWLWVKLVAQHVAATAPQEMDAVVQVARAQHA